MMNALRLNALMAESKMRLYASTVMTWVESCNLILGFETFGAELGVVDQEIDECDERKASSLCGKSG